MKKRSLFPLFISAMLLNSCGNSGSPSQAGADTTRANAPASQVGAEATPMVNAGKIIAMKPLSKTTADADAMNKALLKMYRAIDYKGKPVSFTAQYSSVTVSIQTLAGLRGNLPALPASSTYGLCVHYGLYANYLGSTANQSFQQVMIFEPVVLAVRSNTADSVSMAVTSTNNLYVIANGTLVPLSQSSMPSLDSAKAWMARYKSNTQKNTAGTWGYIKIDPARGDQSDPGSMMIPMVELDSLVADNSANPAPGAAGPQQKAISGITFSMAAETMSDGTYRQSMTFIPVLSGPVVTPLQGAFTGKAGNLAHLCPPSCDIVSFATGL